MSGGLSALTFADAIEYTTTTTKASSITHGDSTTEHHDQPPLYRRCTGWMTRVLAQKQRSCERVCTSQGSARIVSDITELSLL